MANGWDADIERVLDNIRQNSFLLYTYHSGLYNNLKRSLQYHYRIPTIVLCTTGVILAIFHGAYMSQTTFNSGYVYVSSINLVTGSISFATGLLSTIEFFSGVENKMEYQLIVSNDFFNMSNEIYEALKTERDKRVCQGKIFLDQQYQSYNKLLENSSHTEVHPLESRLVPIFTHVFVT